MTKYCRDPEENRALGAIYSLLSAAVMLAQKWKPNEDKTEFERAQLAKSLSKAEEAVNQLKANLATLSGKGER